MKTPLLLLAAFAALPAFAGDDFGIWSEASVQKNFSKCFSAQAGFEFRAEDQVRKASRYALSAGLNYKPFSFLNFGVGYAFLNDYSGTQVKTDYKEGDEENLLEFNGYNVDHAYRRSKHRLMFDVNGKVEFGRFTLSVRERYQYTHYASATTTRDRYRDLLFPGIPPESWGGDLYPFNGMNFTKKNVVDHEKGSKDRHNLRSRFKLEYNIKHCAWTPYVSYEFYNDLGEQMELAKTRLAVGTEWKVTKQHRLDFAYIYEDGFGDSSNENLHALSVSYKFKF